jgi:hypothetical protein
MIASNIKIRNDFCDHTIKPLAMLKKIYLLTFVLTFFISGCERLDLDEPFSAKVGDKFKVDSNLSFSIDSVNDYRCPLLFECFWSGDVKMFCSFYEPHHRIDTAIYLINTRNSINIGGYNFKLLSVNPQSQRGEVIPQDEYKLDIIVQKD